MNHILRVTAFIAGLLITTGVYAMCNDQDYTEAAPLVGQVSGINSGFVSNKVDVNGVTVALSPFDSNGHDIWATLLELKGEGRNAVIITKGCLDTNPSDPSDNTDLTRKFHHVVHVYEAQ